MSNNQVGSSSPTYPNKHYTCTRCERDLWDRQRRLRNPNRAPNVNIVGDETLCDRCYYKDA